MVRFAFGERFSLDFGQSAQGPDEITIWYGGFSPGDELNQAQPGLYFSFTHGTFEPLWAMPLKGEHDEMVGRVLWRDVLATILTIIPEEPNTITLVVERATDTLFLPISNDDELVMEPFSFAAFPNGQRLAFCEVVEGYEAEIRFRLQHNLELPPDSVYLRFDKNNAERLPKFFGEYLVLPLDIQARDNSRPAVKLRVWNPSEMRRHFEFGQPFELYPAETGVGPEGLEIIHNGYGHKIDLERIEHPFLVLNVRLLGEMDSLVIAYEAGNPELWGIGEWRNFEIRVLKGRTGPPYPGNVSTQLLVLEKVP